MLGGRPEGGAAAGSSVKSVSKVDTEYTSYQERKMTHLAGFGTDFKRRGLTTLGSQKVRASRGGCAVGVGVGVVWRGEGEGKALGAMAVGG